MLIVLWVLIYADFMNLQLSTKVEYRIRSSVSLV